MRKSGLIGVVLAAGLSVGACATDRYGYNDGYGYDRYDPYARERNNEQAQNAVAGAAIGAAVGAGVGAIVPGVGVGEGAAVGAVGGAIAGAVSTDRDGRRWYRDNRGCYFIDDRGYRRYDNRAC